jgi:hypothetical protein
MASVASAGPTTYHVTVNTSSISGTSGSLDFSFIPGPLVSQSASIQILNFATDGTLAGDCPCGTGDLSGQLPATLTFDNGTGFNDYFDNFIFGTTISFDVSVYGPALSAPDGVSTSGSTFAFSMFFDPVGTFPVLTSDTADGFAFKVDVSLSGATTLTNFPPYPNIGTGGVTITSIDGVPVSPCDLQYAGSVTVADLQLMINEALGGSPAFNDLDGDGVVNVIDVQIEIKAALGFVCAAN